MKTLSLGTDKTVLAPGSVLRTRLREQAQAIGGLWVIVLGVGGEPIQDGALRLLPFPRRRVWQYDPAQKFDSVTAQDPFETGLLAWRLARRLGARLELQIHTDLGSPDFRRQSLKNWARYWLAKFLLPQADQIRVVSERIKNFLVEKWRLPARKIEVRPIAVDLERYRTAEVNPRANLKTRYPQFPKIILMASRLAPEKNIPLALAAMKIVVRVEPHLGLIIVGSGPRESELKLKADRWQLKANVVFEPWTDQLTSYYKTADLFLQTSRYEGYGLALVEARAAGLPAVSTDVGVAREQGATVVEPTPAGVAAGILKSLK